MLSYNLEELNVTEGATPATASQFGVGFDGDGGSGDQTDAGASGAGAPGEGGGGAGTGADGGNAFAQERERYEATIRSLQSDRDKARADAARAAAGGSSTEQGGGGGAQGGGLTEAGVLALMQKTQQFSRAESTLREKFAHADEALFDRMLEFDSVEAFTSEVERSHTAFQARLDSAIEPATKAAIEAALKPYIEKYGEIAATPVDTEGAPAAGTPTAEEIRRMSFPELRKFQAANPNVDIDSILRGGK